MYDMILSCISETNIIYKHNLNPLKMKRKVLHNLLRIINTNNAAEDLIRRRVENKQKDWYEFQKAHLSTKNAEAQEDSNFDSPKLLKIVVAILFKCATDTAFYRVV